MSTKAMSSPEVMDRVGKFHTKQNVDFDPLAVLHSLRRRWIPSVILGAALGSLFVYLAWSNIPVYFGAEAFLSVSQPADASSMFVDQEKNESFLATQTTIMKSRQTLKKALESSLVNRLSILPDSKDQDPIDWIQEHLSVTVLEGSELVRLSLRSEDATESKKLLEAIIGAYQTGVSDKDVEEKNMISLKLQDAIASMEEQINQDQDVYKAQAMMSQTGDPETLAVRQQLLWQEHADARAQMRNATLKIREIDANIQLEEATLSSVNKTPFNLDDPDFLEYMSRDPIYQNLLYRLTALEQMDTNLQRGSDLNSNASYQRLRSEMELLRTQRAEYSQKKIPDYQRAVAAQTGRNIERFNITRDMLLVEKENMEEEAARLQDQAAELGKGSVGLKLIQNEIDRKVGLLQKLQSDREALRLRIQANLPKIQRVSDPMELSTPDTTSLFAGMVAGGFAGFLIPTFLLVLQEFSKGRIYSGHQVKKFSGLDLLGSIPRVPGAVLRGQGKPKWQKFLRESMDIIATRLIREKECRNVRVLLITSAVVREGKTLSAFHLAWSLARLGYRTLLVDADFRRGKLHRIFQTEQIPGFTELLLNQAAMQDAVQEVNGVENLYFLPTGDTTLPIESELASEPLPQVLNQLRENFEFVILDSAAILPYADSRLLARAVDSTILCTIRDYSRKPEILATSNGFENLNIPLMGFVTIESMSVRRSKRYIRSN